MIWYGCKIRSLSGNDSFSLLANISNKMSDLGSTLPTLFLTFLLAIPSDREKLAQRYKLQKNNDSYNKKK